jgi:hypothetical protein
MSDIGPSAFGVIGADPGQRTKWYDLHDERKEALVGALLTLPIIGDEVGFMLLSGSDTD